MQPHLARTSASPNCLSALAALAAFFGFAAPAPAQQIDDDFESRVDYAFHTENSNTLRNLIGNSAAAMDKSGPTAGAQYQLAYAYFRHGALLGEKQPSAAAGEMSKCVDMLDEVIKSAPEYAEAYALQSMCYGRLAGFRTMTAMINGPRSGSRVARALELAPRNPRAVLADGLADYWRPRAFGGNKATAEAKLRAAIDLFERADASRGSPRWGLADAYVTLGQSRYDAEDTLGARNALERALLVAPEYAAARRLLAKITTTR